MGVTIDKALRTCLSVEWPPLYRVEVAAWYIGAAGLALGHTLVAQLILLACELYRLFVEPEARRFDTTASNVALLALAGWMLFSAAFALKPANAFGSTLGAMLTGWLVLGATRRIVAGRVGLGLQLIKVFLASSVLGATYALMRMAILVSRQITWERPGLPFVGCNTAGTIFAVATLVAIGCLSRARSKERLALGVGAVLMFAALMATQSRGALVAFGAGLAVLAFCRARHVAKVIVVLAVLLTAFVVVYPPVQTRYISILSPASNDDRLDIWRTALSIMKDHPLVGVGVNNFRQAYMTYPHRGVAVQEQPFAHNLFLEFGAASGIPGLLLAVWVVAVGISSGIRAWKHEIPSRVAPVALAVFAALVGHLQFDLSIYSVDMLPLFFIPYGVLSSVGEGGITQKRVRGWRRGDVTG